MAQTSTATAGPLRLGDHVDVALLQQLQDAFAALGALSMQICDADGEPITRPSCGAIGCESIVATGEGLAACRASATAAALSDGRDRFCHAGLRQFVAPVEVMGQRAGTVVGGTDPDEKASDGCLAEVAGKHGLDLPSLREAMDRAAGERLEHASQLCRVLARIIAVLCEQRIEIRHRLEEITTVCDVTGMLSGTGALDDVMAATAARVSRVMGVKAASIRLMDRQTGELVLSASHNLSDRYLSKGAVRLDENPIDKAALEGGTVYIEDATTDPRVRYSTEARLEGIVSGLCVPMSYRGEVVGVLRIYSDRKQCFAGFEIAVLRAIGSQIAAAVIHTRLYDERLTAERYRRQLGYAAEIQRRMIPPIPRHPRITFGAVYDPQLEVGGDFYDFIELPGGNLGMCIADVVGKGVPAALMMASVRAGLRAYAGSLYNINEIIARVNVRLCHDTLVNEFATLFYGVFSPDGTQFTYCNAGHEPPLLLRGDEVFQLRTGGMVIGIDLDEPYKMDVVDLVSGDLIVAVTDGVTEAMNFDDEPFGRRRLAESIRRYRDCEAPILAGQLLWDVRRFVGLALKADDLTLVVAKVR